MKISVSAPILLISIVFSASQAFAVAIPEGGRILANNPFGGPCWNLPIVMWTFKFNLATKTPTPILYPLTPPVQRRNFVPPLPGVQTLGKFIPAPVPCILHIFFTPAGPVPIIVAAPIEVLYGSTF